MQAPTLEQGMRICQCIEQHLAQNEVVAVHCRAGLGRTGTVLAAYLIWEGDGALGALEAVRSIQPRWEQSQAQMEFLEAFAPSAAKARASKRVKAVGSARGCSRWWLNCSPRQRRICSSAAMQMMEIAAHPLLLDRDLIDFKGVGYEHRKIRN